MPRDLSENQLFCLRLIKVSYTLLFLIDVLIENSNHFSRMNNKIKFTCADYGKIGEEKIQLFTLKNNNNTSVKLTNYGGIITAIECVDKNGKLDDIVLGYDSLEQYVGKTPYFGAIIGRYANRIAGGKFSIDDNEYQLATNNGTNALHGGLKGFDKQIWQAESFENEEKVGVKLSRTSPDGEEGFPGSLNIEVTYTLYNNDELHIDFNALTDKPTVINLCNHSYFNLKGADSGSITDHILQINAEQFTPLDKASVPTGELRSVENTPFDFRQAKPIGKNINASENKQIKIGNGYDHNFVLNKKVNELTLAATVYEPTTGRVLEVLTTEPGVQLYTANYLDGEFKGKKGHVYQSRDAFCLETQHFPNSPNQADFPSTILHPKEQFTSKTIFRFSVK